MKKIILDVQHMGKPHKPFDRGATFMQKGAVWKTYREADVCLEYARIAYQALSIAQYETFLITHGSYRSRAMFANGIGADLYLACHLNSSEEPPEKNHAIVEISELAGKTTRAFADHLLGYFLDKLPVDEKASEVRIIKRGERGWSCFNWVKAPALLLEPVFINHPASYKQELFDRKIFTISDAIDIAVKTFRED